MNEEFKKRFDQYKNGEMSDQEMTAFEEELEKLACRAAFSIGNGRELQVLCFFCAVFNSEKQGIFHCIVRNRGGYQVCTKI